MENVAAKGFRLSPQQKRLWPLTQQSPVYSAQCVVRLDGDLHVAALRRACQQVVERHETLRTTFYRRPGTKLPLQVIAEECAPAWRFLDEQGEDEEAQAAAVERALGEEGEQLFDFERESLLRLCLVKLSEREHVLLVSLPALCADAQTLSNLVRELGVLYASTQGAALDEEPLQYADFSAWRNELLETEDELAERGRVFWRALQQRLATYPPVRLSLETTPRDGVAAEPAAHTLALDAAEVAQLRDFSARHDTTPQVCLLACWHALLWRHTRQPDIVVNTLFDGRKFEGLAGALGLFAKSLPVACHFAYGARFADILQTVRQAVTEADDWQNYFDESEPSPADDAEPPIGFEFEQEAEAEDAGPLRLTLVRRLVRLDRTRLTLSCSASSTGLRATLRYDPARYSAAAADHLADQFRTLLRSALSDPSATLPALRSLSPEAARRLLARAAPPRTAPADSVPLLHESFARQVAEHPARTALVCEPAELTYAELNAEANRLARLLCGRGVGPESVVALLCGRSAEAVVALLGVLKAGGAYLPLEESQPAPRLHSMVRAARARLLVTTRALLPLAESLNEGGEAARLVVLDDEPTRAALAGLPRTDLEGGARPANLAYVIFTSGSTGRPKGVGVEHRQIAHYVGAVAERLALPDGASYASVSTLAADLGHTAIFPALCGGGTLHLISGEAAGEAGALADYFGRHAVDCLKVVPTHLAVLLGAGGGAGVLPRRRLVLGGEASSWGLVREARRLNTEVRVLNHYGPTEATVGALSFETAEEAEEQGGEEGWSRAGASGGVGVVPLGYPLGRVRAYVLGEGLRLLAAGETGELYLGGAGVARGYVAEPGQTAERFVPDPFSGEAGARLYRTGDLCRYGARGEVEFVGRADGQVKVRGYRVELGEVEAAVRGVVGVREAAVEARAGSGGVALVCYYASGGAVSVEQLREWVGARLPGYMVPGVWVEVERLPRTANGKVDRKALPEPEQQLGKGSIYAGPRTPTEEILIGVIAEVLDVQRVGIHDNFFELGGHSLLATQLVARLRDIFKVEIFLRHIFDTPKVAGLAAVIEAQVRAAQGVVAPPPERRQRVAGALPLSFAQQRLWFLDQLEPGSPSYNIPAAVRLRGALDLEALRRALSEVVRRHESLRTGFESAGGRPSQVIRPAHPLDLPVYDLSHVPEGERAAEVESRVRAEAARPFELSGGPLFRAEVIREDERSHVALLTMHHIVSDGWSMGVLIREVAALYEAYARGAESPLAEPEIQYADYAVWQREWLQGEVLEGQLGYWRGQLAGAPAVLELPTDRPRPAVLSSRGARKHITLSESLTRELKALSRREDVTMFMLLLAAFQALLHRYTGAEDVVVGSPVAGRTHKETEGLIGFFVNTLALRARPSARQTFRELLRQVRGVALDAYANQDVPFEKLVEELQPERRLGHTPLFQVMLVMDNAPMKAPELSGLAVDLLQIDSGTAKFDLTLRFEEAGEELAGVIEYNTDLFEAATVDRLLAHYQSLLGSILSNPEQRLSELQLLTAGERHQLLVGWNETAREYSSGACVHELFERQAAETPDEVAVVGGGESLSYRELNERANRLARRLRSMGVGAETRVGLLTGRSTEAVVGILGVLKAGGAYVPIDPEYPRERVRFMLEDSGAAVVLTRQSLRENLPPLSAEVVCLDADWPHIARLDANNLPPVAEGRNLAYVIYTSGSTGTPKGVMIQHRGLVNYLSWCAGAYRVSRGSGAPVHSSLGFDLTVTSLFSPLLTGRAVVLVAESEGVEGLSRALAEGREFSLVKLTPSHLEVLSRLLPRENAPRQTRALVVGGEALSGEMLSFWRQHAPDTSVVNEYGPTETVVGCCVYEIRAGEVVGGNVPIGRPIANTRLYVLDKQSGLVPACVAGELYIGGEGLARGYANDPAQTAERFVPDPFSSEPGARLYRTGDLVRYLSDGNLEYLGRVDEQLKVRGYRIEPGEVEAALVAHTRVREAAAAAREDVPGDKRLVAYVVTEPGEPVTTAELLAFLKERLPEHMVPSAFVSLGELPLTANGKLDRRALPAPEDAGVAAGGEFVAPRTPVEEVVAGVWREVLRAERVGIDDNFFELGGHSLLATQVVSRLREVFRIEVTLRQFFESPTVAGLAATVERLTRGPRGTLQPPLVRAARDGALPLSFAQLRLWFLDQLEPNSSLYNIPAALRLTGGLDAGALGRALSEVVRRHEALRTTFRAAEDEPAQVIGAAEEVPLPVLDLSALDERERDGQVRRLAAEEAARPFDLSSGPLLRATLLRLGEEEHVLLITMHHVVTDGWSMGVLVREVAALYEAYAAGAESPLTELEIQYADYAVWQRGWLQGEVLERQLGYWRGQLAGAPSVSELPTDRPRAAAQTYRGAQERFALGAELSGQLREAARRENVTLFMLLLAAFKTLLHRYTGSVDVVVGTDVSNRNQAGTEGLIGFFVNELVLRTDLGGDPSFSEVLRRVREVALDAYAHQDVPFEKLVEVLRPERSLNTSPLFQVKLVLQNTPQEALAVAGLKLDALDVESRVAKFDTTLVLTETPEGLSANWEFNTDLFGAATIRRMWGHLERVLESVALDAGRRLSELPLLTPAEERQLLSEWNDTAFEYPRERGIHELFEEQAARTPDAVALVGDEGRMTYAELNARANRLAHHLRQSGVGPEVMVGVMLERSFDLPVCLLGILKAGGAYVPLDPEYPLERLSFMVEDARVSVLLTQEKFEDALPALWAQVVCVDAERELIALASADNPPALTTAANLAYVVYTSGSTGRPKGVSVTHRSVVRLVRQESYADFDASETFLQFAPVSFDASTFEIWGSLLNGARLAVMPPEKPSLEELGRALRHYGVTTLWLTAGLFQQMVEERLEDLRGLRQLLAGGDVLSVPHVARVLESLPGCRLINGYGPTESTTFACCHVMTRARDTHRSVPIGRPIANTQVYLLDERLRPVPVGVTGELYIGGDGLARGYFNQPALTADKFIPNPFSHEPGARLYRTGDRALYLPDGDIEFLGRADDQIKLRGYRVELGEVEAALHAHPALAAAVVVAAPSDPPTGLRLLAYYVTQEQSGVTPNDLRRHLQQRLPAYMVPSAFVELDELPLTANGKLDRRALPAPEQQRSNEAPGAAAAQTATEELLAGLFAEVLKVGRVGRGEDFFELGGHSLLATQVVSRVRSLFGVEVALRALFERPTVAGFAGVVDEAVRAAEGQAAPPLVRRAEGADEGGWPLSFAQQRLWFLDQLEPGSASYNIPAAVRLTGALDAEALGHALSEVVRRHESLRTSFATSEGQAVQVIGAASSIQLPLTDLSGLDVRERDEQVRREAEEEARRPFDLSGGPLLRARLLRLGESEHVLLVTMHHVVSDGWSMGVLVREVAALYEAYAGGEESPLEELPIQYADYAVWQRGWLQGEVLERQLDYWRGQLTGAPAVLELPTDRPRPEVQTYRGAQERFALGAELSGQLREAARRENVTLFMLLLAAFKVLLSRWSGQEDIVVGSPIAGRNRAETEGLIGFFVNTLVLRADLSRQPRFRELLGQVREVCLGAYAHQDVPFEKLVEELQPPRRPNYSPLFQVAFGVENTPAEALRLPGLELEMLKFRNEAVRFDLTLWVTEQADGLSASWSYSTDLFEPETVARLQRHYEALLRSIVAAPDTRIAELDMRDEDEKEQSLIRESEWDAFDLEELLGELPTAVTFSEEMLVSSGYLQAGQTLPLVLQPQFGDVELADWARNNRDFLETELAKHGAILFRNFGLNSPAAFGAFVGALAPELMSYSEPSTPRTELGGGLYTSTEYDAAQNIPLHNELSYAHQWPQKIWFFCETPAAEGGQTPIADCRKVYEYLDAELRERLIRRRVLYVRNFGDGLGLPWQTVFRTDDRHAVEAYCRQAGIDFVWRDGERLRTRQVREAALRHPRTGEMVWFNQAHLHQVLSLEPDVREALLAGAEDDAAPLDINAFYGDGEPLEPETVTAIQEAFRRATVAFDWQRGDVLMLDNMLVAHGRRPFAGRRKVLVAMADPCAVTAV